MGSTSATSTCGPRQANADVTRHRRTGQRSELHQNLRLSAHPVWTPGQRLTQLRKELKVVLVLTRTWAQMFCWRQLEPGSERAGPLVSGW